MFIVVAINCTIKLPKALPQNRIDAKLCEAKGDTANPPTDRYNERANNNETTIVRK